MCLDYGRKALEYILRIGRRSSICGAYMQIATTFAFLQQTDSAAFYTDKAIPYLKDYKNVVGENIHPDFFSNIGYNYMVVGRYEEAKQYLEQSLMVKVTAVACNYLAWIYKKEGDEEQSHLWYLKAHEIKDNWPKDKILFSLLQYDIAHKNMEGAQEKLKRMMTISDSLHKVQMDRTILEYQHRFDEQAAQEAHQRKMIWVGIALGVLLFVIVLLALYIRYRRAKEQVALTEKQMLINNYVNEIAQLKSQQNDTDVAEQIEELNGKIRELVEQNSPRLVRGKMLYDDIKKDGTTSGWSNDDYKCFIDYYKAIDFPAFCRIQKKYAPNTPPTPSSSFSTRWAWKTRTSAASWASPKRPSAPQGTEFSRMGRSDVSRTQKEEVEFPQHLKVNTVIAEFLFHRLFTLGAKVCISV